ncbi:endoribonuclease YicC domain-containing protein [Candidatus Clavichlamydia salmonicola]|uniref:endoribonuclease YicC domain-containing protein n=1 Tax=Candidatus Clavichlamydia salmonicola TaxID=469812 RepID=UPI0018918FC0|nr:DUF1732 domain-containing protein [Candidatus Clavichlamydia salmonicola]
MLKSMTAYGRGIHSTEYGSVTIELVGTNRRHLDIVFHMPHSCLFHELILRRFLTDHLGRGGVQVYVKWSPGLMVKTNLSLPDLQLSVKIKEGLEYLSSSLGYTEAVPYSLVLKVADTNVQDTEIHQQEEIIFLLNEALKQAVKEFVISKSVEGNALYSDLILRVMILKKIQKSLVDGVVGLKLIAQKKLEDKCKELSVLTNEIDLKIFRELSILLDKGDITEELVRIELLLQQLDDLLKNVLTSLKEVKGKHCEFLIQELLREFNTVGSKSSDSKMVCLVINAKLELEKIKEQVQNIE